MKTHEGKEKLLKAISNLSDRQARIALNKLAAEIALNKLAAEVTDECLRALVDAIDVASTYPR